MLKLGSPNLLRQKNNNREFQIFDFDKRHQVFKGEKMLTKIFPMALLITAMVASNISINAEAATLTGGYHTIAAGGGHSLVIKTDESLWAWGHNYYGELGDSTTSDRNKPVKIMDSTVSVAAGWAHSLAVKTDKSLWAWGYNGHGQLGDGTVTIYDELMYIKENHNKSKPIKIMDDVTFTTAGYEHSFAIKTDGSLWAWGSNSCGQLGDGTNTTYNNGIIVTDNNKSKPIKIMDNVIFVEAGGSFSSFAIKSDGSLWAWGDNRYGRLGDGTATNKSVPTKIMDDVVSVTSGRQHTLALKTDGSVWAWGRNAYGELGDGTTQNRHTPVKIMDNVIHVTAGNMCSFVIKTDGSLWSWGSNGSGILADGTNAVRRNTPLEIMSNVVSVAISEHGLAIKKDGSLWSWGSDNYGELGKGTIRIGRNSPIKIMDGVKLPSSGSVALPVSNKPSAWAEEQVAAAIRAKLVPQSLQSQYTQATNRAEFCALAVMLYETVIDKEVFERKTFNDTKDVNVEKAAAIGIVSGTGNGNFSPNNKLTREQAAVMLASLAGALESPLAGENTTFADKSDISSWAADSVGRMQASGIMNGTGNNKFSPKGVYTREQSIITIKKLYDMVNLND